MLHFFPSSIHLVMLTGELLRRGKNVWHRPSCLPSETLKCESSCKLKRPLSPVIDRQWTPPATFSEPERSSQHCLSRVFKPVSWWLPHRAAYQSAHSSGHFMLFPLTGFFFYVAVKSGFTPAKTFQNFLYLQVFKEYLQYLHFLPRQLLKAKCHFYYICVVMQQVCGCCCLTG